MTKGHEKGNKVRQQLLESIIGYIKEHGYPPTIREMCVLSGLKSTSTVQAHIDRMINEGMLETDCDWKGGSARALRVPGYKFVSIGEYCSKVSMNALSDGAPTENGEYIVQNNYTKLSIAEYRKDENAFYDENGDKLTNVYAWAPTPERLS